MCRSLNIGWTHPPQRKHSSESVSPSPHSDYTRVMGVVWLIFFSASRRETMESRWCRCSWWTQRGRKDERKERRKRVSLLFFFFFWENLFDNKKYFFYFLFDEAYHSTQHITINKKVTEIHTREYIMKNNSNTTMKGLSEGKIRKCSFLFCLFSIPPLNQTQSTWKKETPYETIREIYSPFFIRWSERTTPSLFPQYSDWEHHLPSFSCSFASHHLSVPLLTLKTAMRCVTMSERFHTVQ